MAKIFLTLLILTAFLFSSTGTQNNISHLISDYNFTNQEISYSNLYLFVKQFTNTSLDGKRLHYLFQLCSSNSINPMVMLVKLEQENGLVINSRGATGLETRLKRAVGFGLKVRKKNNKGELYCPYLGYYNQIKGAVEFFRHEFDIWNPSAKINQLQDLGVISPKNASSFALYKYCPVYGEYKNYGFDGKTYQKKEFTCVGNKNFIIIFDKFMKKYNEFFSK